MQSLNLLIQRLITLAILVFLAWYCWLNRTTLGAALQMSPVTLLAILLSYFLIWLLHASMMGALLRKRGKAVPLQQLLGVNAWAALAGHSTLAQESYFQARAAYYRQLFHVQLPVGTGLLAYLGVVVIFTNAALGILVGVWAIVSEGLIVPPLYWLVLSTTLLLCVSIVLGVYKMGGVNKLPRRLQVWVANLHAVFTGTNPGEVLLLIGMVLLVVLPQVYAFTLLFSVFSQQIPLVYLVYMVVFSNLVMALTFLPANLGVRELVLVLFLAHLDMPLAVLVSVLVLDRLLQLLMLLVLGTGGWFRVRQSGGNPLIIASHEPESRRI